MGRKKKAQDYSAEEFNAVVALIQADAGLRADIEAITGQKLDGKNPRDLFNLFRAINTAADVQASVVRYGRARQAVRQTRVELENLPPADMPTSTAAYVERLQTRLDEAKREVRELKAAAAALHGGKVTPIARPVVKGEVAS